MVTDYAAHPLRRLHTAGVPVPVAFDDPTLFGTTLSDEVVLLTSAFGFDEADVTEADQILLNGIEHSFLPEAERGQLAAVFRAELDHLKPRHLSQPPRRR